MSRRLGSALALLLCAATSARAEDDAAMGRRLQEALRAQRGEIHACYGAALGTAPDLRGEVLVRLVMGEDSRVAMAEVLKDQAGSPVLTSCLTQRMRTWRLPQLGASAGDEVVFPLVFRPDEQSDGARRQRLRDAATRSDELGEVIDYQGGVRVRAVAPGKVLTLPPGEAAGLLYVLAGQARPRAGLADARDLRPGDAILGGTEELRLQSVGVGPLRLLRLPMQPPEDSTRATPLRAGAFFTQPGEPGREGQVRLLLDAVSFGKAPPASLAELSFPPGAGVPPHQHEGSDELIYIVAGSAVMTAGAAGEVVVGPGDVILIPRGTSHHLRVTQRLQAVQSYTPSGPEARFRRPPAGPQGKKP